MSDHPVTKTVGWLRDMLSTIEAAAEDVDPPMTADEINSMPVVIRVFDDEGELHVGGLSSAEIVEDHSDRLALVIDGEQTIDAVQDEERAS